MSPMTTVDSIQRLSSVVAVGERSAAQSVVDVVRQTAVRIVGSELRGPYVGAGRTAAIAPFWPLAAPHGGGLLEQARANAASVASQLSVAHEPVAVGRLERAALDFGREARTLFIGGIDWSPAQLTRTAAAALDAAAAHADALPDVGLTPIDRAVAFLDHATRTLADAPHPSLAPPSNA